MHTRCYAWLLQEGHTAAELALEAGHRDIADLIGQHAPNSSHGYGKDVDAAFNSAPTPASSPLATAQHLHAHGQRLVRAAPSILLRVCHNLFLLCCKGEHAGLQAAELAHARLTTATHCLL